MSARFHDRVVYITGAGSGVGAATAALFAAEGAKVFAVDVDAGSLARVVGTIRDSGGAVEGGTCDVAAWNDVQASVGRAVAQFGGLHVLINAAGIGRGARLEEIDAEEWQRVLGVNLNGVFNTTKAAIEHLIAAPGGVIVNVASIAGLRGQAYAAHYCASKAGVVNFTRAVALEFASRGLRANCICPGGIRTPLIKNFVPRSDFEPQLVAYYSPPIPGQFWEPEDVAKEIAFLASDDAKMMNGAALVADGGTIA